MSDRAPSPPIQLRVNGASHTVASDCTVAGLIEILGIAGKRIAVAVNRDVVPRSTFANHPLTTGDQVEILEAVGGG